MLTVHDGRTAQRFQGTGIQDQLVVPPPEPVHLYNAERWWLLRDANWSPDCPTTAQLEQFFLRLDLHREVSGVLNVTPAAAAEILQATGPLYAPEYRRWITAGNVAALADYYTHWSSRPGPRQYASPDTTRKQFILIVARHVLARLGTLAPAQWLRLGGAVGTGISHGDILLYFPNRPEEALVRAAGASGAINRTTSDYLYVVDTNLSYNKISPYVQVRSRYQVGIRPDRWLDARLRITITDGPVPASFRLHGIGPGAGAYGGPLDYADFLRVYAPAGAQLVDQSGWTQPWSPGPAYGKMEFSGYLIVRNGQTRTVYLHYVTPPNVFTWSHGQRYRLLIQHQPGSHPAFAVSVQDGSRSWTWTAAKPSVELSRTVGIGNRPFQAIPLPPEPRTVVAAGHWIEPHAFLATPNSNSP